MTFITTIAERAAEVEAATDALKFVQFPKIPRLKKEVVITEKVDGTSAQIAIIELGNEVAYNMAAADPYVLRVYPSERTGDNPWALKAGSRNRWLKIGADNFNFAGWVLEHSDELKSLGLGRHYGEWYGKGIQRDYGLWDKKFALFNVARWNDENPNRPACCQVVPILARGENVDTDVVMEKLFREGSVLAPGYGRPEGIVVFHSASRQLYKRTFDQDGGKWAPSNVLGLAEINQRGLENFENQILESSHPQYQYVETFKETFSGVVHEQNALLSDDASGASAEPLVVTGDFA
jgi:hypothetical protein